MKLIIDIPDFTYEEIKKTELTEHTEGHIFHALSCIKDGTHIPDNATNGDVIKALFPDCKYGKTGDYPYLVFKGNGNSMQINEKWWNAPYKRGETE